MPFPSTPPVYTNNDVGALSHLNWLFDVYHMFKAVHFMARMLFGADDGVVAFAASGSPPVPTTSLQVQAESTPSMRVEVLPGAAMMSDNIFYLDSKWTSDTLAAPSSNPRIDIVEVSADDNLVKVKTGAESGSPAAPSVDAGYLKIAEIYHTTTETVIKDADDASNGYITDSRDYCNT
jgi:hypothetical protein